MDQWIEQNPNLFFTKYQGAVLDDEIVEKFDYEDLSTLTWGCVLPNAIRRALSSTDRKKQLIRAALEALERNHIYTIQPSTIDWVKHEIAWHGIDETDIKQGINELNNYGMADDNYRSMYLIRENPTRGFYCEAQPTRLKFGICQGCLRGVPIGAPCPKGLHNTTEERAHCRSEGPRRECFSYQTQDEAIKQACQGLSEDMIEAICGYALHVGNVEALTIAYSTGYRINLDAAVYDKERPHIVCPMDCFQFRYFSSTYTMLYSHNSWMVAGDK